MRIKIPRKLKDDCILEALCEIRFSSPIPAEIVLGRLTDCESWNGFRINRLPISNVPESIRMQDPGLRYQPSLELLEIGGNQRIRVGGNVISLHVVKPYCGWNEFSKKLKELTTCVFEKVDKVSIERIGFRYINAFNSKLHDIKNVNDLNIKIQSGDKEISELFNLNYLEISDDTHKTLTKVATTNFMSGELPADTSLVVDIDVSSTDKLSLKNIENTVEWLDSAHKYEKVAFFKLFKEDVLKTLVEEW